MNVLLKLVDFLSPDEDEAKDEFMHIIEQAVLNHLAGNDGDWNWLRSELKVEL